MFPIDIRIVSGMMNLTYEQSFICLQKHQPPKAPTDIQERTPAMKKTYRIDVDCANCANKMEEAAKATKGVKNASVNFMALKMKVEFEDGADVDAVMQDVVKNCKVVEDDCQIFFD